MMKTIAITIEESTLERLDRLTGKGRSKRHTRSEVIRRALEEFIARLDRQKEDDREQAIIQKHYKRLNREAAALVRAQAKL